MTGSNCLPMIAGTCHHGAGAIWDSKNLPGLVLKPDAGTNEIMLVGSFQLLKSWDDESAADIVFTNVLLGGKTMPQPGGAVNAASPHR